ncbi:retrotransposon protein, putative, ty3-gypsy subclass, partial [Tanacetum coccineum]
PLAEGLETDLTVGLGATFGREELFGLPLKKKLVQQEVMTPSLANGKIGVCGAEYKMIYKQDFMLEHCFNILKDHQGWIDIGMPNFYNTQRRKKSKTSDTTSGSASVGIDLNDEVDEETEELRPMGRDRSKAKKKSSGSSRAGSSSFVDLVADKFLNMKPKK